MIAISHTRLTYVLITLLGFTASTAFAAREQEPDPNIKIPRAGSADFSFDKASWDGVTESSSGRSGLADFMMSMS